MAETRTKPVSVRLPPEVLDLLDARASEKGSERSDYLRELIVQGLNAGGGEDEVVERLAALDRGAVREVVDEGVTGGIFADESAMADGLRMVMALDRQTVRARAVERFGVMPMVDGYVRAFTRIVEGRKER